MTIRGRVSMFMVSYSPAFSTVLSLKSDFKILTRDKREWFNSTLTLFVEF